MLRLFKSCTAAFSFEVFEKCREHTRSHTDHMPGWDVSVWLLIGLDGGDYHNNQVWRSERQSDPAKLIHYTGECEELGREVGENWLSTLLIKGPDGWIFIIQKYHVVKTPGALFLSCLQRIVVLAKKASLHSKWISYLIARFTLGSTQHFKRVHLGPFC